MLFLGIIKKITIEHFDYVYDILEAVKKDESILDELPIEQNVKEDIKRKSEEIKAPILGIKPRIPIEYLGFKIVPEEMIIEIDVGKYT